MTTTSDSMSLGFVKVHVDVARRQADAEEKKTGFTDLIRYDQFVQLLFKQMTEVEMAFHITAGLGSEAGEAQDVIKRQYIYKSAVTHEGKPIREGIIEELGDLRFYIQACMNHYAITEQEILDYNANKLSKRYKDLRYTDKEANERADKQERAGDSSTQPSP